MARTKGAKGKKTLAKEKGMTLEQYLEYEKKITLERIVGLESMNKILNPGLKTLEEEKKKEEKDKEDKNFEPTQKPKQELILEQTVNETEVKGEVKNKVLETEDETIKIKTKKKKDKEAIYCERCHKPITGCIPFKTNISYLTTLASYHRQTSSDRVQLCYKCIDELNHMIDKWLWDEGRGLPLKYGDTVIIN